MAEIRWTDEAVLWLYEIYEKIQILKIMPEVGYKYQNRDNVRILLYGHYKITYFIKNKETIDILGIFHGSLDIERYLKI